MNVFSKSHMSCKREGLLTSMSLAWNSEPQDESKMTVKKGDILVFFKVYEPAIQRLSYAESFLSVVFVTLMANCVCPVSFRAQ